MTDSRDRGPRPKLDAASPTSQGSNVDGPPRLPQVTRVIGQGDRLTRSSRGAAPNPILGVRTGKVVGLGAVALIAAGVAFGGGYLFADAAGDAKADVLQAELTTARTDLKKAEGQLRVAEEDYAYLSELISRAQDSAAAAAVRPTEQSGSTTRENEIEADEDDDDDGDDDMMTDEQQWLWEHRSGVDGPVGIDSPVQDDHPKPSYSDCATRAFWEEQCSPGWNG